MKWEFYKCGVTYIYLYIYNIILNLLIRSLLYIVAHNYYEFIKI